MSDVEDRVDLTTGAAVGRRCSVGDYWSQNFEYFDDFYQRSHTRYPGNQDGSATSARLHRAYCNSPLESYALWDIKAATLGTLPNAYISDHLLVVVRIAYKDKRNFTPCIPHFVTKGEVFKSKVEEFIEAHSFSSCCWARVLDTKDIFFAAYEEYRTISCNRGALLAK